MARKHGAEDLWTKSRSLEGTSHGNSLPRPVLGLEKETSLGFERLCR